MTAPAQPELRPGHVYRTRDLAKWSKNPSRLANRLVQQGELLPLQHGLFVHPKRSRFGDVPPNDHDLLDAFLDHDRFVFTGPDRWNALGLGSTAVFAAPLVYNRKRSGTFQFGGRPFVLRRVAFPDEPSAEWFVVDLLEHGSQAGVSRTEVARALARALARGTFDRARLREMAEQFGSMSTRALVDEAVSKANAL